MRTLTATILALPFPATAWAAEANGSESVTLLQSLCSDCHGSEKQKGKFALHDIDPDIAGGKDIERWEKILEMVGIGDMRPEDERQPTRAQRQQLVAWLTAERTLSASPTGRCPILSNRAGHSPSG